MSNIIFVAPFLCLDIKFCILNLMYSPIFWRQLFSWHVSKICLERSSSCNHPWRPIAGKVGGGLQDPFVAMETYRNTWKLTERIHKKNLSTVSKNSSNLLNRVDSVPFNFFYGRFIWSANRKMLMFFQQLLIWWEVQIIEGRKLHVSEIWFLQFWQLQSLMS